LARLAPIGSSAEHEIKGDPRRLMGRNHHRCA